MKANQKRAYFYLSRAAKLVERLVQLVRVAIVTLSLTPSMLFAAVSPGPPPWECEAVFVCNTEENCILLPSFPNSFVAQSGTAKNEYLLEGMNGSQKIAKHYVTLQKADDAAKSDHLKDIGIVLISTKEVSDAVGFRLHNVGNRGGERFIKEESLLISCNSYLRP